MKQKCASALGSEGENHGIMGTLTLIGGGLRIMGTLAPFERGGRGGIGKGRNPGEERSMGFPTFF